MAEVIKSGPIDEIRFMDAEASVATAETNCAAITITLPSAYLDMANGVTPNGFKTPDVQDTTVFATEDEILTLATGGRKVCLQRHNFTIVLLQPNPWLLLLDAMIANEKLAVQIDWSDGDTSTWNGVRFQVKPLIVVPSLASVSYHDTPTSDPVVASGFTSMGTVFNDEGASFDIATVPTGDGLTMYASTAIEHIFQVAHEHWSGAAKTTLDDGDKHAISFGLPDGTNFGYKNVVVQMRRANAVGLNNVRGTQVAVTGGFGDLSTSLALPGQGVLTGTVGSKTFSGGTAPTMADCIFGLELTCSVSGVTESDFYKEA